MHPLQRKITREIICTAEVIDYRRITDSGGHPEMRYVIRTSIAIGKMVLPVELSLTNREQMRYRLLLGRTAMRPFLVVDPALSFTFGKPILRK